MLKKLAQQTAIYGTSSIVARLLNYLVTPYLTYYVMSQSEYGVITDMYAMIPFAMVLLTMGLETGYFRFASKADTDEQRQRVFASTWGAVSYASIAFFAIMLLFNRPIATAMGYAARPELMTIAAGIVALDAISAIPFARLRQQGRAVRFVVARVVSVIINLALCFFFYSGLPHIPALASIYNPEFGTGYYMVANLVASLFMLIMVMPSGVMHLARMMDWKLLRTIMIYSFPLLISGIAGTATEFIDRQMIKFLTPEADAMAQLGIYGAVIKLGVVMVLFTQMYRLAAEPFFLANFRKEDFMKTNAAAMKYFIIASVGIFLMITLFTDLFALILGQDFREGIYVLPVILLFNILAGVVLNLSFWYKQSGQTRFAIMITGTGLAVTVALGLALIPRLGYCGAAWTHLAAEAAMVVVSYALSRRYCPVPYQLGRIAGYVAVGGALYIAGIFAGGLPTLPKYLINLCLLAAFGLYAIRMEKIDVAALIRSILKR